MDQFEQFKVLVVGCKPDTCRGIETALAAEADVIETSANADEAWSKFAAGNHALIVIDLDSSGNLPGVDLLKRIIWARPLTAVVMIAENATVEATVDAMNAGASDFALKPVDFNRMVLRVRKARQFHKLVREDIPLLVDYFLYSLYGEFANNPKQTSMEENRNLTPAIWPGSVHQLRNVLERMAIVSEGDIAQKSLSSDWQRTTTRMDAKMPSSLADALVRCEKIIIQRALEACNHHRERTAKALGISVRTLHYKIGRYGLH